MKTDPLVARPSDDISTLIAANVGSLPVIDAGRVVGIVTLSDTIRAYFSSLLDVKALMEELAGIIASSFDGIYLTDASGRVLQANEAFTRITGMAREELLGFTMDELVARGVFKQPLDLSALQRGQTVTISQEVRTGKEILVTSNPIRDEGGRLLRVVHNVRDMTELNSLRDQLEKAEGLITTTRSNWTGSGAPGGISPSPGVPGSGGPGHCA
jgi:PAS domain S-box-containing protein